MNGAKPLGGRSTEVEVDDADCVVLVPRWGLGRLSCSFVQRVREESISFPACLCMCSYWTYLAVVN
jgi:hypothetical protein